MSRAWLVSIVVVGAVLRFVPIWFGLPFLEARPDEETAVAHATVIANGDFNPHFFHWPSLTFYLFAACFKAASWFHELTVQEQFLTARAVVALAGTLTIIVLFRLSRRVADEETALTASFFLAVAFLHVRDSHFAMTDILMTLLVVISLALLVRAFDTPGVLPFAAAGLAGGLATSTKYSAAAIVAAAAAAQLILVIRSRRAGLGSWKPGAAFFGAFVFGFIAATPYALLDYRAFADGVAFDLRHLSSGHAGNDIAAWMYHLTRSLPLGLGVPLFAAACLGVIPLLRHHRPAAIVLIVFCAAFYAAIGRGFTVFFRYVLPLVPIACLSAAVAVTCVARWLSPRIRLSGAVIAALLATLVAAPTLFNSLWLDAMLARTDSRVVAGRWLAERVQPHESLYDAGGDYSRTELGRARVHVWSGQPFDPATSTFKDAGDLVPDWLVLPQSPLQAYTLVPDELWRLAARRYTLIHVVPGTPRHAAGAVYDVDDAFFVPVSGIHRMPRPGPTILVYRRNRLETERRAPGVEAR